MPDFQVILSLNLKNRLFYNAKTIQVTRTIELKNKDPKIGLLSILTENLRRRSNQLVFKTDHHNRNVTIMP